MKKKLLLFFAFLLCLTSTFAQIYVAKDGNDVGNSGTLASPYLTIQQAADVAKASDMVMLKRGTYPFCFELLTNY